MDIFDRILILIKKYYGSHAVFERTLALPKQQVNNWKRGISSSYLKILPQIAEALHTSTSYLLGETDDPSPPGAKSAPSVKEGGAALQRALVDMGYVSEGEELTDAQIRSIVEFAVRNKQFIQARAKEIEESQKGK